MDNRGGPSSAGNRHNPVDNPAAANSYQGNDPNATLLRESLGDKLSSRGEQVHNSGVAAPKDGSGVDPSMRGNVGDQSGVAAPRDGSGMDPSMRGNVGDHAGQNAGHQNANNPGVNAGQHGSNNPGVNASQNATNDPGVSAGHGGGNNPGAGAEHNANNPGVNAGQNATNDPGMNANHGGSNDPGMGADHGGNNNVGQHGSNNPGSGAGHGGGNNPGVNAGQNANNPGAGASHGGGNNPGAGHNGGGNAGLGQNGTMTLPGEGPLPPYVSPPSLPSPSLPLPVGPLPPGSGSSGGSKPELKSGLAKWMLLLACFLLIGSGVAAAFVYANPANDSTKKEIIDNTPTTAAMVKQNVTPTVGVTPTVKVTPTKQAKVTPTPKATEDVPVVQPTTEVEPTPTPTPIKTVVQRQVTGVGTATTTVKATGKGVIEGAQATGSLTLRNVESVRHAFPAGYTISNGVITVVFDQGVTMGAGSPRLPNYAYVNVHVQEVGTVGNVGEMGFNVTTKDAVGAFSAYNEKPFSGGRDNQTYTVVAQGDVDGAYNSLRPTTIANAKQDMLGQAQGGERFVGEPYDCVTTVEGVKPAVGSRSASVTVAVKSVCKGTLEG